MPGITLGDVIPNVEADSTVVGHMKLYDYLGNDWGIIFSHPADFTPVCTTELGSIAKYLPELKKRNVKVIGISNDSVEDHKDWIKDIEAYNSVSISFPILADPNREITTKLNMVDPDEKDENGRPRPSRALHIIGPDKKVDRADAYITSIFEVICTCTIWKEAYVEWGLHEKERSRTQAMSLAREDIEIWRSSLPVEEAF